MNNIITHQPWCDREEHGQDDDGLCVTRPLHVGDDHSIWLERQSDGGIKVILDTNPRSGAETPQGDAQITPAQAKAMSADLVNLVAIADKADQSVVPRPAWATETREPQGPGNFGMHSTTVRVGAAAVRVEQVIDLESTTPEPVVANLSASSYDLIGTEDADAQHCRDLAAALLEAARIIEEATA